MSAIPSSRWQDSPPEVTKIIGPVESLRDVVDEECERVLVGDVFRMKLGELADGRPKSFDGRLVLVHCDRKGVHWRRQSVSELAERSSPERRGARIRRRRTLIVGLHLQEENLATTFEGVNLSSRREKDHSQRRKRGGSRARPSNSNRTVRGPFACRRNPNCTCTSHGSSRSRHLKERRD